MRWPWISRETLREALAERDNVQEQRDAQWQERLNVIVEERDRLLKQNAELLEHTVRMSRVQMGRSETPRKERPPIEPMPKELQQYINGFDNPSARKYMRDEAYKQHGKLGKAWSEIMGDMMPTEEAVEVVS